MSNNFCTQCGKETNSAMKFCGHCGFNLLQTVEAADEVAATAAVTEIPTNKMNVEPPSNFVTVEELATFIDHRKRKFIREWGLDYSEEPGDKVHSPWNWYAFLFGVYWLTFRKMYLYAIGLFLIQGLLFGILALFLNTEQAAFTGGKIVIYFALYLPIGKYGNDMYYHFAKKKVLKLKTRNQHLGTKEMKNKLKKSGGVSVLAVILLLIIGRTLGSLSFP